jgi:hypothetical protein
VRRPSFVLPYRSAETFLCIDAICINQIDVQEKNHQVPLMADIYSSAARVLIWLGTGDQGTDRFMDWVQAWRGTSLISSSKRRTESVPVVDLYWLSLTILLRNWFSRIWIMQEAVLAKQDPDVICGSRMIPLAQLAEFLQVITTDYGWMGFGPPSPNIKPFLEEYVKGFDNPGDAIQQLLVNQTRLDGLIGMRSSPSTRWLYATLKQALLETIHHEATNTRDKIYGLLGIISEKARSRVHVDYKWNFGKSA